MNLFYLVPLLLLGTSLAFADTTFSSPNTDLVEHYEGDHVVGQATIYPYERLQTGTNSYTEYRVFDKDQYITFESATVSANFYDDGNVKLFSSGMVKTGEQPLINNISHTIKEALNGTDDWHVLDMGSTPTSFTYTQNLNGINATQKRGDWLIQYDVNFMGAMKWTYRYTNNDEAKTNYKYGFTTVFSGDFFVTIDGHKYNTATMAEPVQISAEELGTQLITIQDYNGFKVTFDPQNNIHDYLWAVKIQKDKIILDFTFAKNALGIGQTLIVDPTFGFTAGTQYRVDDKNIAGGACHGTATAPLTVDTTMYSVPASGGVSGCAISVVKFDLSSVPYYVSQVANATVRHTSSTLTNARNCDYVAMGSIVPNVSTTQQVWDQIMNATKRYVANSATCTATGLKLISLGGAANTDIKNQLGNITNQWSLGYKANSMVRDASVHQNIFSTASALQFVYVYTPSSPTGLSCTSVAYKVNCSWTGVSHASGYYLGRSLNNSTFTNKTSVSNTTSTVLSSFFKINQLYYMNVTALGIERNSTSSSFTSFTTDTYPSAPQNPTATAINTTSIIVRWAPPSSSGGDPITGYKIDYCITCVAWTNLVNETNTLNYNQTGIAEGTTVTYRIGAWNNVGLNVYSSNFTGQTAETIAGSTVVNVGVIGDVSRLNATVTLTAGNPTPLVQVLRFFDNGTLISTQNVNQTIPQGTSYTFSTYPVWNQITDANVHAYTVRAYTTNTVGPKTLNGSATNDSREYNPDYFSATDPSQGLVNFTVNRLDDEDTVNLKVNRDEGGNTFQIECLYQDNSQAAFNGGGTWHNFTNIGFLNDTLPDVVNTHIYITCYNDALLFTTTSYTNSSLALFGIEIFDDSYGQMLGVPVGIFFLAMAGSMANKRTAPTWIVVVLAMAGAMAAIGFFSFNPLVWGLALVTGLLGIFVNQKVF